MGHVSAQQPGKQGGHCSRWRRSCRAAEGVARQFHWSYGCRPFSLEGLDGQVGSERGRHGAHVVHPVVLALACSMSTHSSIGKLWSGGLWRRLCDLLPWQAQSSSSATLRGAAVPLPPDLGAPACKGARCSCTLPLFAALLPLPFPLMLPLMLSRTEADQVNGGAKVLPRVAEAGRGRRNHRRAVQPQRQALHQRGRLRLHCCSGRQQQRGHEAAGLSPLGGCATSGGSSGRKPALPAHPRAAGSSLWSCLHGQPGTPPLMRRLHGRVGSCSGKQPAPSPQPAGAKRRTLAADLLVRRR